MPVVRARAYISSPVALREPLHMDAILVAVARGETKEPINRASHHDAIARPPIPIASLTYAGHEIYMCTAAEVAPEARRSREHLTRRRDGIDLDHLVGRVDTRSGPGRDVMMPYAVWLTPYLEWICVGSRQGIRSMIRSRVTHVGIFRRHGMGEVARWDFTVADGENPVDVLARDSRARRNLPAEWCREADVFESVPVRAPYWHPSTRALGVMAGRSAKPADEVVALASRLC